MEGHSETLCSPIIMHVTAVVRVLPLDRAAGFSKCEGVNGDAKSKLCRNLGYRP